ncbi:XTP/dITP diphosphatase [Gracilibacillus dipsosauri]|uniref:XTP/dITP diphosphatase n=1 Tax=Gracilibacillus dipsosauri TaxID=178340 RepID=UPI00240A3B6E
MKELIIATKNKGKIRDFEQLFSPFSIQVKSLLDIEGIEDIEETGSTFEENAAIKAEAISNKFGVTVIADDSGLVVDALNGAPGVYSARYAGEDKDDQANIEKVLSELQGTSEENRTARFVCVLAVSQPAKETFFTRGECEGTIGYQVKGEYGFGYDPIFYPLNSRRTMAEMRPEEKNQISHRKKALDQLKKWVEQL